MASVEAPIASPTHQRRRRRALTFSVLAVQAAALAACVGWLGAIEADRGFWLADGDRITLQQDVQYLINGARTWVGAGADEASITVIPPAADRSRAHHATLAVGESLTVPPWGTIELVGTTPTTQALGRPHFGTVDVEYGASTPIALGILAVAIACSLAAIGGLAWRSTHHGLRQIGALAGCVWLITGTAVSVGPMPIFIPIPTPILIALAVAGVAGLLVSVFPRRRALSAAGAALAIVATVALAPNPITALGAVMALVGIDALSSYNATPIRPERSPAPCREL